MSIRTPDTTADAQRLFGLDLPLTVPAFADPDEYVPERDESYHFDPETTLALLLGFAHNRRVLLHGRHGSGKSTHIEQVAARLNWGCLRVNLDGQVGRLELVGRDVVTVREGKQVTEFREGILPWAVRRPVALVLDEYDAARPDVLFALQRLLEKEGRFPLLERNEVLRAHPAFRIFATANTSGLGDQDGLYQGVRRLNHAQLDRWSVVARLDYVPAAAEVGIVTAQVPGLDRRTAEAMVELARLTRRGQESGDLATLMSTRTVVTWAENTGYLGDPALALRVSFINKCSEFEREVVGEYFQRCFGRDPEHRELRASA
ncbi:AAA family ATPase [Amycolatopsis jiangsuensis]|uniref:Cobaltochelatase CobS n=1 Tax=Amycolatopsis jiangsuensis TaxID=1181879 RepID=A0A840ISU7_9PSEU|nr:MoxR family ATPase [Amycolatopsis jiangsuensis]MBB4684064.1 cobaltochelatase CobS [Amycolatopsis jiangsuensis]